MGLINKLPENTQKHNSEGKTEISSTLTQAEIQFVLSTLRECTFKGSQVLELYNTVLKLQQQYKDNEK